MGWLTNSLFSANRYLLSGNYDSHHSRSHTFTQVVRRKKKKKRRRTEPLYKYILITIHRRWKEESYS